MCDEQEEEWPCSVSKTKTHKRRWRKAFNAICFTRILVSLSNKARDKNAGRGPHSRTLSYVAIDIMQPVVDEDSSPDKQLDQKTLSEMVRNKNSESLNQFGGVKQLVLALETDAKDGVNGGEADLIYRKNVYGANKYKMRPPKCSLIFVIEAIWKNITLIFLLLAVILLFLPNLVYGIIQYGWKDVWYDGGGNIVVAVVLVVVVSAVGKCKKSRQFEELSRKRSDVRVEVVREGRRQPISIFEVVVGDIVCLKIGDQIPADGLFLEGHSLMVDESSMITGTGRNHVEIHETRNPFLLSGTKVTDGFGSMLVTSVGMNTLWGEKMSSRNCGLNGQTKLQAYLIMKLIQCIVTVGLVVAALVLAVRLIWYFTGNTVDGGGNREFNGSKTNFSDVVDVVGNILTVAGSIILVSFQEGLVRTVTLTLAYCMKRMMAEHAMVRNTSAFWETIGSATIICTDKTGILTTNEMKVTEFWVGKEAVKDVEGNVLKLLQEAAGLNTTGAVYKPNSASDPEISGSPTEKAILSWALFDLGMNLEELENNYDIIRVEAFNSVKQRSGVLVKRNSENTIHTHWKGAAEIVLASCSSYYDKAGMLKSMDAEERLHLESIIKNMAAKSLRCIAFAYKEIGEEIGPVLENSVEENELTLVGLVGLKDPCRPGARAAIESCRAAGVDVKMITGDNVHTARAVAIECGILNPDGDLDNEAVLEGVEFRNYSPEQRMEKINKIRVMARSSPSDKLLMVQCLKQKGHVVAVTGDGINDALALKQAHLGLSMGVHGTEVAKQSSDVVIMDDDFESVVAVLKWGRCVYNNIQNFLQFELTAIVVVFVVNIVAAVNSIKLPLTALQLLWVNVVKDILGSLAFATEKPSNDLMAKPPVDRSGPLIARIMSRNLVGQAVYQVTILLVFFGGDEKVNNTLFFNTFVLCQVFNAFNARNVEKKNIFKGLLKNKMFLGIIGITVLLQTIMVGRLDWGQWGACIGLAALSWPIAWLVKCIPVCNLG